jgi:hypothetical protein
MPNLLVAGNSTNGGTAISTDTSGTLNIVTGSGSGSTAIAVDASQNVGIGTTSPTTKLNVQGFASYRGDTYTISSFSANSTLAPLNITQLNDGTIPSISAGQNSSGTWSALGFMTNGTERVRIDTSGNLLIGTTTATGKVTINGANSWTTGVTFAGAAANTIWQTGFTSQALSTSLQATGGSIIGNGVYSVSDSRMKENIIDIESGMDFVNNVNPVQFDWKELKTKDTGFIAQDLLAKGYSHLVSAIPDATMQEVIESDGNVSPEGLRLVVKYESIVPILCKAIQELKAELDALKAKVGE